MSASATPSVPVSINTLVLLAYKRAGVVPVESTTLGANMTAKLAHGRQLLDLIIDGLAVDGFNARVTTFLDLSVSAGTHSYTLTDTVLDVIEDAMFVPDTSETSELTEGETVIKQMDLTTWQLITNKGSESSRPQMYVVTRTGATPVVKFWPVPNVAGAVRLKVIRLLGSNATGTDNVDLQRFWIDALVWLLSYYVAVDSSMPAERVMMLQGVAETKKKQAMRYSFEHTGTQAVNVYSTQWSM